MGASITLGSIFGIPIRIHFSWFVFFALFTFFVEGRFDRGGYDWSASERLFVAVASGLLLAVSLLVHEMAHSLVAISRGMPVKGITLFIFGGVSQIAQEANRASVEFIVALVGPLASLVIGFLFFGLAIGLEDVSQHLSELAWVLFSINIALAVFNMLPCFPMDGGRVLRAAVWGLTKSYWLATRVATIGGQIVAAGIIVAGVVIASLVDGAMFSGLWLAAIGVFIQTVVSANGSQSRLREKLRFYTAEDLVTSGIYTAAADTGLDRIVHEHLGPSGSGLVLLTRSGVVQGMITLQQIKKVRRSRWSRTSADSLMVPLADVQMVGPKELGHTVLEIMDEAGTKQVLVAEGSVMLGYIDRDALNRVARRQPASAN